MSTVDPYPIIRRLIADLAGDDAIGPVSARQMGEAAVFASAMLAALGVEPAVDGDATHRTVLRCRWLLELLRKVELPEGGGHSAG